MATALHRRYEREAAYFWPSPTSRRRHPHPLSAIELKRHRATPRRTRIDTVEQKV
ncbi:hypothetical protein IHE61_16960 [Streptomyces sp. GKU 257-1]|nr:hypothetical protein [Streptomyces sp. GKU 257-1]